MYSYPRRLFGEVNAIIGSHGSGKSALLQILEAGFGYTTHSTMPPFTSDQSWKHRPKPTLTGTYQFTLSTANGLVSRIVDIGRPYQERAAIWQDVESAVGGAGTLLDRWWPQYCSPVSAVNHLTFLYQESHISEPPDGAQVLRYSSADLRGLTNILGRRYRSVSAYTVVFDDEDIPFVIAQTAGGTIDSWQMSAGQVWVHYLFWFLQNKYTGSVALVDEPETFIAQRGHRALMDEIGRHALHEKRQLIIATHSATMIDRFPHENVLMCVAQQDGRILVR